ncbi:hypothetical protein F5Y03DRAFT_400982 [Xylaria venustula]|nr:hypothetical protein F5Y03DRAFT_400982 [Xylaria venustula]
MSAVGRHSLFEVHEFTDHVGKEARRRGIESKVWNSKLQELIDKHGNDITAEVQFEMNDWLESHPLTSDAKGKKPKAGAERGSRSRSRSPRNPSRTRPKPRNDGHLSPPGSQSPERSNDKLFEKTKLMNNKLGEWWEEVEADETLPSPFSYAEILPHVTQMRKYVERTPPSEEKKEHEEALATLEQYMVWVSSEEDSIAGLKNTKNDKTRKDSEGKDEYNDIMKSFYVLELNRLDQVIQDYKKLIQSASDNIVPPPLPISSKKFNIMLFDTKERARTLGQVHIREFQEWEEARKSTLSDLEKFEASGYSDSYSEYMNKIKENPQTRPEFTIDDETQETKKNTTKKTPLAREEGRKPDVEIFVDYR